MVKKRTEVTLDVDLKAKARENGINLSQLFNQCLKEKLELLEENTLMQI